ncbi:MAG: hypothetical protein EBQ84_00050, partial [Betaproteobacteria bacterium]|nr:hypothetical protein [Betaproteobacteria bacterium]
MSWKAIHTEASNGRIAESDPITVNLTRTPVADTPQIFGPSKFTADEGSSISLSQYEFKVAGFTDSAINSSVTVDVSLGVGTTLNYTNSIGQLVGTTTGVSGLSISQFKSASIKSTDPNFESGSGVSPSNLNFTISAKQTLGTSVSAVDSKTLPITFENVPEDVNLPSLSSVGGQILTGSALALPPVTITNIGSGEKVIVNLSASNNLFIKDEITGLILVATLTTSDGVSKYTLDYSKFSAGNYQIFAPLGTTPGTYTVTVGAQSVDTFTGKAGLLDNESFTILIKANSPATVASSTVTLNETNSPLIFSGKVNVVDSDPGQAQVVPYSISGVNGAFTIKSSGDWTYTANSSFDSLKSGEKIGDTFAISSIDGTGKGFVIVTINGTNDAAVISGAITGNLIEAGG